MYYFDTGGRIESMIEVVDCLEMESAYFARMHVLHRILDSMLLDFGGF